MASEISGVFKDISIQFELDDYEDLLTDAKQKLSPEMFASKPDFEKLLCEWINNFRDEVTSSLISECLDLIQESYKESAENITEVLKSVSESNKAEISPQQFASFVSELIPLLEVRIVDLTTKKPKSDENVCGEKEEAEFFDDLTEYAIKSGETKIDLESSERLLIEYFKRYDTKYCFVMLKIYGSQKGIDPYQDLGEDNPFSNKKLDHVNPDQEKIFEVEEEIEQAEDERNTEKVNLLKKIKHFYEMKMKLDSEHEKDNIELMIAGIRKQIHELEAHQLPRENQYELEERNKDKNMEYSDSDNYYGQDAKGERKNEMQNDYNDKYQVALVFT